jgi:hypothetical protein
MIPYRARPPYPIYMRAHGRLRGTQSSKTQNIYFYLQTLIPLFQTIISFLPSSRRCLEANIAGLPTLDQPMVLLPWWDPSREEVCWFKRQRSYIPIWPAVLTGLTDWSSGDQKFLHMVVFVFNGTFRCQHTSLGLVVSPSEDSRVVYNIVCVVNNESHTTT